MTLPINYGDGSVVRGTDLNAITSVVNTSTKALGGLRFPDDHVVAAASSRNR